MASFKSHPFFYTSLLLIGAVIAGEAWLFFSQRSQASALSSEIDVKKDQLQAFARQNPFPSDENLAAVKADRAQIEKTRDEIRQILRASGEAAERLAAAKVPGSPTDAYFDIANYVERVRQAAAENGVELPAENRLGFSLYSSTGPERDLIAEVFEQRQYADYLFGVLIAAKPASILSLQRERPLTPAQRQQNADSLASGQAPSTQNSGDSGDYFTIDSRVSAEVPGFVETSPFRLTFTGTTSSLRSVLNQLARFELPVVVRSVEVEPLNKTESGSKSSYAAPAPKNAFSVFGGIQGSAGAPAQEIEKPIVEGTASRFTVTVEFISLVDESPAADAAPAAEITSPEAPTA